MALDGSATGSPLTSSAPIVASALATAPPGRPVVVAAARLRIDRSVTTPPIVTSLISEAETTSVAPSSVEAVSTVAVNGPPRRLPDRAPSGAAWVAYPAR